LEITPPGFLLIDDGPIADAFAETVADATIFNPRRHSFSIARDYKSARDFADILYSHGYGEQTLTVRNGRRKLAELLLDNTTPLHKIDGDRKDPATAEALGMLDELWLSPVLKRVLTRKPNFDFSRSVIARVNRAELGDFDAFVLALLLMGQHKGQVIVPDFGFYGRPLHTSLIRQNRLTVGLRYLAELPLQLQQAVLTIEDKHLSHLLPDDAETLIGFTDNPSGNPKNLMA
jgi:hypothetical protein